MRAGRRVKLTVPYRGHGPGLSIVRAIATAHAATAHAATVTAQAPPGGGLAIEVTLPPPHTPSGQVA